MNYKILFLVSIIIFLFLSIANVVVLSSGRIQIGTPLCQTFNDNSGTRCASILCSSIVTGGEPNGSTCYDDQGIPTHLNEQSRTFCELPDNACVVTDPIRCDAGNRTASYGRECASGGVQTVSSRQISCPISCTCPQPIGQKPCRRATWNTNTCRWNDAVCGGCGSGVTITGEKFTKEISPNLCSSCNPSQFELDVCWQSGGTYDWDLCFCSQSPIVIDVLGNGFSLTNAANGVRFDINGDSVQEQLAWTSANSDDVWLSLDRNGNGLIDDGTELFGNNSPQPAPPAGERKNGFLALAVYDKLENGGNNDGQIDSRDSVFSQLKLWQDTNHNGISETSEMQNLLVSPIRIIELEYRESKRTDEHGNRFRYRAKVKDERGAQVGRWAWDVFLVTQPIGE